MIRTFDFVFILRRDEDKKRRVYHLMEYPHDDNYEIEGWSLSFDYEHKIITIYENGKAPCLKYKFIPAEITYDSLRALIEMENPDYQFDIAYLE